jgi:hypothetical protein
LRTIIALASGMAPAIIAARTGRTSTAARIIADRITALVGRTIVRPSGMVRTARVKLTAGNMLAKIVASIVAMMARAWPIASTVRMVRGTSVRRRTLPAIAALFPGITGRCT